NRSRQMRDVAREQAEQRNAAADRGPTAANRAGLGNMVTVRLPDGVEISVPQKGMEQRFIAFIQYPSPRVDVTTWFDLDRLQFDTGSASLKPESQEQLRSVAEILKANPNVHVKIGGYTDNVGDSVSNLRLSQARASSVAQELMRLGVPADHCEYE